MSLQLRCNYSAAAAQLLREGGWGGEKKKNIRMQKERAVHAEWQSKTDRGGLAIGRVRK